MKKYSLDELTDKYVGERGTPERKQFEFKLKTDVLRIKESVKRKKLQK